MEKVKGGRLLKMGGPARTIQEQKYLRMLRCQNRKAFGCWISSVLKAADGPKFSVATGATVSSSLYYRGCC